MGNQNSIDIKLLSKVDFCTITYTSWVKNDRLL